MRPSLLFLLAGISAFPLLATAAPTLVSSWEAGDTISTNPTDGKVYRWHDLTGNGLISNRTDDLIAGFTPPIFENASAPENTHALSFSDDNALLIGNATSHGIAFRGDFSVVVTFRRGGSAASFSPGQSFRQFPSIISGSHNGRSEWGLSIASNGLVFGRDDESGNNDSLLFDERLIDNWYTAAFSWDADSGVGGAAALTGVVFDSSGNSIGGRVTALPSGIGNTSIPLETQLRVGRSVEGLGMNGSIAKISIFAGAGNFSELTQLAQAATDSLQNNTHRTVTNLNASGTGSLRAIVSAINADPAPGPFRINFARLSGSIPLSGRLEFPQDRQTIIDGTGADIDIIAPPNDILIHSRKTADITLQNLSITGGNGVIAATFLVDANAKFILNRCNLTRGFSQVAETANNAFVRSLGSSTLTLRDCSFSGFFRRSSVVEAGDNSTFSATNCTFTGNEILPIRITSSRQDSTLNYCTITRNTLTSGPALIQSGSGTLHLFNTIIAGNNLASDTPQYSADSTDFDFSVNFLSGDPQLLPAARNGSPYPALTCMPTLGSPVVGASNTARSSRDLDARGRIRGLDSGNYDLGAAHTTTRVISNAQEIAAAASDANYSLLDYLDLRTLSGRTTSTLPPLINYLHLFGPGPRTLNLGSSIPQRPTFQALPGSHIAATDISISNPNLQGGALNAFGGAAYLQERSTTVFNRCILSQWSASLSGGALFTEKGSSLSLSYCTLAGNSAISSGGALYIEGNAFLNHCTFDDNTASLDSTSSTIRINNHTSGGKGGTLSLTACTLDGNTTADTQATAFLLNTAVEGNLTGVASNNIINSRVGSDLRLEILANNGDPVPTRKPQQSSPLIDQGRRTAELLDARGRIRIAGSAQDIGAVESSAISLEDATPIISQTNRIPPELEFDPGLITISWNGALGLNYQFESSPDLITWIPTGRTQTGGGNFQLTTSFSTNRGKLFYRIRLTP